MDAVDGMIGDAFEYTAQIVFRIDAVQLGRAEQSVDRSCTFSSGIGARKEIDDMTAMWS